MPPAASTRAISRECHDAVGEEHQRHLAQHGVELLIGERERGDVAVAELDVGTDAAGDRQHRLVEVDTHDRAARSTRGRGAGDDPGAAGDVEHPLPGRDTGGSQSIGAHWAKNAGTKADS